MYYGMYLQIKKVTFSSVPVQNRLKQCFKHTFGRISELLIASIFEDLSHLMNTQDNNGIRKKTDYRKVPLIDCEVRLYSFSQPHALLL